MFIRYRKKDMKIRLFNLRLSRRYRHPQLVREQSFDYRKKVALDTPKEIYKLAIDVFHMDMLAEEYVYIFCMDTKMQRILGVFELSHGTVNYSIASPREALIRILLCGASNIVLLHNHPSGDVLPSQQDISLTKKIWSACNLIEIPLTDHIIIGREYFSFRENFPFIWEVKG